MLAMRPADQVNLDAFILAFNLAYSDYYIKIMMSPRSFENLLHRDSINWQYSVAATDGDKVVGTALLAHRGERGWIGGVGVIPEYRQQGIGRQMMTYLIDNARLLQLQEVALEVITVNAPALHLYQTLGFEHYRRLVILEHDGSPVPTMNHYDVESVLPNQALSHFDNLHDAPNPWQRSYHALNMIAQEGWVIHDPMHTRQVKGFCLTQVGFYQIHIIDLAVSSAHAAPIELTKALVSHIHQEFPGHTSVISNFPDDDLATPALREMGYIETIAQYEMILKL